MVILLFAVVVAASLIITFINYRNLAYVVLFALVIGQLGRLTTSPDSSSAILLIDVANALYVAIGLFFILVKRLYAPRSFPLIILTGFLGSVCISLIFGSRVLDTNQTVLATLYAARLFLLFGTIVVSSLIFPSQRDKERLLNATISAGLILVGLGYLQLLFVPDFSFMAQYGWDPHQGRLLSTFFDPNYFGMFLTLIASLFLARILTRPEEQKSIKAWGFLLGTVIAIFLTYSRSSYLAFIISIFIIMSIRSWKLVLLTLVSIVLVGGSIPRVRERVINAFQVDTTAEERIESWKQASIIIKDNLILGVGYNAYGPAQLRYHIRTNLNGHSTRGSDSSFLLILATTGIIGFSLYLFFWLSLFVTTVGRFKLHSDPTSLALLGIIPSYLIHSQFVNSLLYPLLFIPFALILASDLETLPE